MEKSIEQQALPDQEQILCEAIRNGDEFVLLADCPDSAFQQHPDNEITLGVLVRNGRNRVISVGKELQDRLFHSLPDVTIVHSQRDFVERLSYPSVFDVHRSA